MPSWKTIALVAVVTVVTVAAISRSASASKLVYGSK